MKKGLMANFNFKIFASELVLSVHVPEAVLLDDGDEDDVDTFISLFTGCVTAAVERIPREKITNYINIIHGYCDKDSIMHFRLSRTMAYYLVNEFQDCDIYKKLKESPGRPPNSAEVHILCLLWFAGHECASYRDVADRFGLTISTLYNVLSRTMNFVCQLQPSLVKLPTENEKKTTESYFRILNAFPGIIGAIDGSHIRISKPKVCGDAYINRKKYFSIQLQGVVNHERKFIHLYVGFPGRVHDARVFKESNLANLLPGLCAAIPNYVTKDLYILGDSAYPCLRNLITPYKNFGSLTQEKIKFNQRLSRCRIVVENAFGDLKQRFRQMYCCKIRNLPRLIQFITVCCMLHNIASSDELCFFEPPVENEENPDPDAINMLEYAGGQNHDDEYYYEGDASRKELRDHLCRQFFPATR